MHARRDTHDTSRMSILWLPRGFGARCTDQLAPSQRSIRLPVIGPKPFAPATAVHALDDVHDTAPSVSALDGLGVRWMDHCRPFQRAATAPACKPAPTAIHHRSDTQETDCSKPAPPEGMCILRQREPFHRLTTVPTAMQKVRERHDTPSSEAPLGPGY
jgi:hypothetical protein